MTPDSLAVANGLGAEMTVELALSRLVIVATLSLIYAAIVEGALEGLFTWKWFDVFLADKGLKYPLSVIVSYVVCSFGGFSAIEVMYSGKVYLLQDLSWDQGVGITCLFVARGSKYISQKVGSLKQQITEAAKPGV